MTMDVPLKLIVKDAYAKLRMKIFESFLSSMGNLSNSERRDTDVTQEFLYNV